MITSWAKVLPHWILVWLLRRDISPDGAAILRIGDTEYPVRYFQIGGGEFVVFSKDIQDRFDKRKESRMQDRLRKKLDKLNHQLNRDYFLKKKLREQFEDESEAKKLVW